MFDDLPFAGALSARRHRHDSSEERIPSDLNAAGSAARGAGDRVVTRLRAEAVATITGTRCTKLDLPVRSHRSLLQGQRNRCPDIGPSPGAGTTTAESASEELLENVVESTKLREQIPAADGLAVVVASLSLRVRQHLVGLGDLAKADFGGWVIRIRVRVGLPSESAECVLDLVRRGISLDTQGLVVVLHYSVPRRSSRFSPISSTTRIERR